MILIIALFFLALWVLCKKTSNPLQDWCNALLNAALRMHPTDTRVKQARRAIRSVDIDTVENMVNHQRNTVRRGKFDRKQGHLFIGMVHRDGAPLPMGIIKGILVHEVAHAGLPDGKHSDEWRAFYLLLLDVATNCLGWEISLECSSCKFYGVCHPKQCPLCAWKKCAPKLTG